jgi:hypothetical protein
MIATAFVLGLVILATVIGKSKDMISHLWLLLSRCLDKPTLNIRVYTA